MVSVRYLLKRLVIGFIFYTQVYNHKIHHLIIFLVPSENEKKKKCITVFDKSPPNFRSWKMNKWSNFWPFRIFLKCLEKKLFKFEINVFFCISMYPVREHIKFVIPAWDTNSSLLGTLKIMLSDQDTNKVQFAYWLWIFNNLWLFRFFKVPLKHWLLVLLYLFVSWNGSKIFWKQAIR